MQNFMVVLLICSVAMSVLALLYMAATPYLAERYSEKGRYYAWLIIVVGLIIPFRPQWGNALVNVIVPPSDSLPVAISGEVPSRLIPVINRPSLPSVENVIFDNVINISWWQIAVAVWLAGVIVVFAYHGIRHIRFMKMARRWSKKITDGQILFVLESLKSEMGISKQIPIYLCPVAGSPMMTNLIKPRILLPSAELEQDELRLILKHELMHYKRKDLLYKYLVLIATALHWFNPVVYLIPKAVNVLCEMSCDAEVLRSADKDTRRLYGETIIGVAQYQPKQKTALSTNFYGGRKSMKNRISSIMDTRKKRTGVMIIALVLILAMGAGLVLASNPAQADDPADFGAPTYVQSDEMPSFPDNIEYDEEIAYTQQVDVGHDVDADIEYNVEFPEGITITTDNVVKMPETFKHGDYYVVTGSGVFGRILEDDTPVFFNYEDSESVHITYYGDQFPLIPIHQGAIFEVISEVYNDKVLVHVSSEGGWQVHNGWDTWVLWIPYDSFELI